MRGARDGLTGGTEGSGDRDEGRGADVEAALGAGRDGEAREEVRTVEEVLRAGVPSVNGEDQLEPSAFDEAAARVQGGRWRSNDVEGDEGSDETGPGPLEEDEIEKTLFGGDCVDGCEQVGLEGEEGVGGIEVVVVMEGMISAVGDRDSGEDERYESEVENHLVVPEICDASVG